MKCYFLSLSEEWKKKDPVTLTLYIEEEKFQRGVIEEEKKKSIIPTGLNKKGILIIPEGLDFSTLSEEEQIAASTLIASGRVIEVKSLYCAASIQ